MSKYTQTTTFGGIEAFIIRKSEQAVRQKAHSIAETNFASIRDDIVKRYLSTRFPGGEYEGGLNPSRYPYMRSGKLASNLLHIKVQKLSFEKVKKYFRATIVINILFKPVYSDRGKMGRWKKFNYAMWLDEKKYPDYFSRLANKTREHILNAIGARVTGIS